MSFQTALTGLNAASADLGVIGNNIANSNTTGFKSSRTEFADLFSRYTLNTTAPRTIGGGVQLGAVLQQFQQGSISATGNPLDMAIEGNGFFRLSDNGNIVYTRAGSFGVDNEGYVVNSSGLRLTGYQVDAEGNLTPALGELQIDFAEMPPQTTTSVDYGLNLNAEAEAIDTAALPFDPTNPDSYNYVTSVTVYDSLGVGHTLDTYFVKPDATANDWEVYFTLDGGEPFDTLTDPPTPTVYGPEALSFDDTGQPTGDTLIDLTGVQPGNGAADLDLTLDFSDTTQFGSEFSVHSLEQDGFASGQLNSVNVTDDGTLLGRYSNGQSQLFGQVALVDFRNPQGLQQIGDNNWVESAASGVPLVGTPGSGTLGRLRANALEGSNVDLTQALVNMINAQRNFQANAQTLSTADSLTQTLINLR